MNAYQPDAGNPPANDLPPPTCLSCGAAVSEGASFCPACGALQADAYGASQADAGGYDPSRSVYASLVGHTAKTVQTDDGAYTIRALRQRMNPDAPDVPPADTVDMPVQAPAETPAAPVKKKRVSWKLAIPAAVAVVVLAAVSIGIVLTGNHIDNATLYVSDNTLYAVGTKGSPRVLATDLSSSGSEYYELDSYVRFNEARTRVFFVASVSGQSPYQLQYADMKNGKRGALGKFDDYYLTSRDGTLISYTRNRRLYIHDLKSETSVAPAVDAHYLSADGKRLLYKKDGELYYRETGGDSEALKVDSNITGLHAVDDSLRTLYYVKMNTLYRWTPETDRQKVAGGIEAFYGCGAAGLYYTVKNGKSYPIRDLIVDDVDDAYPSSPSMPEPNLDDYFQYYDDDGNPVYDDYQYKVDLSDYWQQMQEPDYSQNTRENRERLLDQQLFLQDLYFIRGTEEPVRVIESIGRLDRNAYYSYSYGSMSDSADRQSLTCAVIDPKGANKISLTELMNRIGLDPYASYYDASQYSSLLESLLQMLPAGQYYAVTDGSAASLEKTPSSSVYFARDARTAYYIGYDGHTGDPSNGDFWSEPSHSSYYQNAGQLMRMDKSEDGRWDSAAVDSDVFSLCLTAEGRLFYTKEANGVSGLYEDGKLLLEGVNAGTLAAVPGTSTIFCLAYNESGSRSTMYLYDYRRGEIVAEIAAYDMRGLSFFEGCLYYLEGDTLYLWQNGGTRELGTEVKWAYSHLYGNLFDMYDIILENLVVSAGEQSSSVSD